MLRRKKSKERGAAAVEFALVLPFFLLLVLGTIDYGYFFFVSEVVTNAAREGARAGSVLDPSKPDSAAEAEAKLRAEEYLKNGGLEMQGVTPNAGTGADVNPEAPAIRSVRVDIAYPVGSITGFLPVGVMIPEKSKAHAVMRWQ
jgi:Flp pilus assembly protein TadG